MTFISAKRVPVGTKNGRENRKRRFDDACRISPDLSRRHLHGQQRETLYLSLLSKSPGKATLVLLTGGIGLSDLFYKHFARFARDFSVLTFDYQLQFGDNGEFADAVAELLRHLKEKVWLWDSPWAA